MASRAQPSASSAVWPNITSLGSSAIVSTTPDGSIGSTLIRYLFVMVRLPPFVDWALKLDEPPEITRDQPTMDPSAGSPDICDLFEGRSLERKGCSLSLLQDERVNEDGRQVSAD